MRILTTSSHHPNGNASVELASYTMALSLALVVTGVELAYTSVANASTRFAPNELHMKSSHATSSPCHQRTLPRRS